MSTDLDQYASHSISTGSRSFSTAARLFDPQTRRSAMLLYSWCRYCDDLIDGQHLGYQRTDITHSHTRQAMNYLRAETLRALAGEPIQHPAFAALQAVAGRHRIPARYPLEHLAGFAMDVAGNRYQSFQDTLQYCYHVAGVVGIMMAQVMGVQDEKVLDRACDLGIAFQLTNIARDIVEDATYGRCYLPEDWLDELKVPPGHLAEPSFRPKIALLAGRLVHNAEPYYHSAKAGLAALPLRSAWAIAAALGVYRHIGIKVLALGDKAWDQRISTYRGDKLRLLAQALVTAISSRVVSASPRPPQLWERPV